MRKERSAGIIIFRIEGSERRYLLLKYNAGHWDFPKGHVEGGETDGEAAVRETAEETGIKDIKILQGFKEEIRYHFRGKHKNRKILIDKEVVFFLAETKIKDVKISFEHKGFEWLDIKNAVAKTSFKNSKNILEKADKFLNDPKS
ncbi:MAG: hypothetical protein A2427_02130 [Candidatus Nealsonbacteria bacterium RIFOXYC1_FULL_40_7]|uniref:Bis(5'-nucleosyl)-tetraphosphatase [asymmetrical] n=1 Tax=Candidatus Nealsonbacteria bacterium RIFOXYC1_FULL_40_7 TaxID=1801678 RepID=A0A1G2ETM4_9BACT|nr:MAG: hypothetical protein A2562_03365 [Candidatus Nealsonbacteria bacterium RIFOXYD1_FULL_39_11]OGZ29093.1 MAG: hypothetical protein A2427_02130 [Candidatus Nealsonbacteria bacterium RIFOXYC1_FULL_40_7]